MKINKTTGFWLRILSRAIDLLIVFTLISVTIYLSIDRHNGKYRFYSDWLYYLWTITSAYFMLFFTTLIPIITNGRSIGNFVTKTKIVSKQKMWKAVFYREIFFGISWTLILIIFSIIITPKILIGFITNVDNKISLSSIDQFRFAFVNTIAGVVIFAQFIFAISILIKKTGKSLIDSLSNSRVVRINKFISQPQKEKEIIIEPRMVKNIPVEWIRGD